MKKKFFKYLDMLLTKSENPKGLFAIEKLFIAGIPFNKPHGIKFEKLNHHESRLKLPYKRLNQNHLKGIHACGIATIGEFSAGLLLTKNFSTTKYRVIMKSLNAEYIKQAKTKIYANAKLNEKTINHIKEQINREGSATIELQSFITNPNDEQIAIVTTDWQLKDWNKTSFQ